MPSNTIHSALVQMYYDLDGAPWQFAQWQEITKVRSGLFHTDDAKLPKGWTREQASFIHSYFTQYNKIVKEDAKITFSSAKSNNSQVPGREIWRNWVTGIVKDGHIHRIITQVLSDNNLHPLTLCLNSQSRSIDFWPDARVYVPLAVDAVALELFGAEALDPFGRLQHELRNSTQAIIQRTWGNLRNQINRSKSRIERLEQKATEAFAKLDREKLTKANLQRVIVQVGQWKKVAEYLCTKENNEKIERMDEELKRLMLGLGADVNVKATKNVICKVDASMLRSLATEEDVADIIFLYTDFFSEDSSGADEVTLENQNSSLSFKFGQPVDGADPGVEVESSMSPEQLAKNLGFVNGLPLLFNTYRNRGGLNSWEPVNAHLFEGSAAASNPEMQPAALHWHQLAGVHAIVRMNFTPKPVPGRCCGTLIADEVGLGKTMQATTTIAFLSDLLIRRDRKLPFPPIIVVNPYVGAHSVEKLPSRPHLILVPGTLLRQWEAELRIMLKPKSFDILLYAGGKKGHNFWAADGPYHKSIHSPSQRIILATHSALSQDFNANYSSLKVSANVPWAARKPLPTFSKTSQSSLYGLDFFSVTVDEAHVFRNVGPKHSAVLLLKSLFHFALTATPLQTKTPDIAGIGRLIRIPHFLDEKAYSEEKQDVASLRKAKAELPDDYNPLDADDDDPIKVCQVKISERMQQQFENRIIRRNIDSLNWKKEPLIKLPPCHIFTVHLDLAKWESEIIEDLAERVKANSAAVSCVLRFSSRSFYIEYRMGVCWARRSLDEPLPHFKTLQEWSEKKSTKFDFCALMCQHILSRDDAPGMIFENGTVTFPPVPRPQPGEVLSQDDKIVVYGEFPSLSGLVHNVFDLYGIKHLFIDGNMSFEKRAKVVSQFNNDAAYRVLFLSSVGAVGLNLSRANHLVFMDQPWSAQDERQFRGRIHRQPQQKEVRCYHLLANDTADIILSGLARGKRDMMEAFLRKPSGKAIFDMLSGNGNIEDDLTPGPESRNGDSENEEIGTSTAKVQPVQEKPAKKQSAKKRAAKKQVKEKGQANDRAKETRRRGKKLSPENVSSDEDEPTATNDTQQKVPETQVDDTRFDVDGEVKGSNEGGNDMDIDMPQDEDHQMDGIHSSSTCTTPTATHDSFQETNTTPKTGQRRSRWQLSPESPKLEKKRRCVQPVSIDLVPYSSSPVSFQHASPPQPDDFDRMDDQDDSQLSQGLQRVSLPHQKLQVRGPFWPPNVSVSGDEEEDQPEIPLLGSDEELDDEVDSMLEQKQARHQRPFLAPPVAAPKAHSSAVNQRSAMKKNARDYLRNGPQQQNDTKQVLFKANLDNPTWNEPAEERSTLTSESEISSRSSFRRQPDPPALRVPPQSFANRMTHGGKSGSMSSTAASETSSAPRIDLLNPPASRPRHVVSASASSSSSAHHASSSSASSSTRHLSSSLSRKARSGLAATAGRTRDISPPPANIPSVNPFSKSKSKRQ